MKIQIHDTHATALPHPIMRPQRFSRAAIAMETVPYAILGLRVTLGLLFLAHGWLKVFTFTLPGTAQFFASVGLPGFMAAPVALVEIVGGLMLIAGVFPRWTALGLFPIALVATLKVHGDNGWLFTNPGGGWEFPALLTVACLVQFLLGNGAYALGDRWFHKR
jgi:putative oxidoreductase